MPSTRAVLLALAPLLPAAHAWGSLGHMTVGYLAQLYMTDETVQWAQGILGNDSSSYLAGVATWADTFRYTAAGKFSAPFHFIDANDNPPTTCGVDLDRDCGASGCVVSAIANYTQRVQDGRLSATNQKQALEFLVHFLGDVTQPLHDEAHEVGGNDIAVTFDGTATNLHHIWDTNMPEKLIGGYAASDAMGWAKTLSKEVDSGDYASEKASWIADIDLDDVETTALRWAQDANAFVCSSALKGGDSAVEKGDLGGAYYTAAVPVFTKQIAKGGIRLAAFLNTIVTGSDGF